MRSRSPGAYQPFRWNGNNARKAGSGNYAGTPTIIQVRQLDAVVGGPLDRDRVWFFGSARYSNLSDGISAPREVGQVYNPNYLQLRNQQPARALQMTLMFRY